MSGPWDTFEGNAMSLRAEQERRNRHLSAPHPKVEQWTVTDAYNHGALKVFESSTAAITFAFENARADRPTTITAPDGRMAIVLRPDPDISLQAVRKLS